jgi:mannosyltransferase OCH1-like enzyme
VNLAKILGVLIFVIFAVLILHYFSYFFFLGNYYIYRLENGTITNGPLCTPNPNPPTNEKLAKIFHQTWKADEVPPMYKERVEECKKLNSPNYTYMFWTDESTRNFMKERFPDYLALYDSYPLNIQRADVSRYFILYYYGGVYMDLDIGCVKPHDLLYSYDLILPKTNIGISNDLLLSRKEHPFFKQVIDELINWKLSWGFSISPYAAVMYSTGPGFLTVQLTAYVQNEENKKDACVLSPGTY